MMKNHSFIIIKKINFIFIRTLLSTGTRYRYYTWYLVPGII